MDGTALDGAPAEGTDTRAAAVTDAPTRRAVSGAHSGPRLIPLANARRNVLSSLHLSWTTNGEEEWRDDDLLSEDSFRAEDLQPPGSVAEEDR